CLGRPVAQRGLVARPHLLLVVVHVHLELGHARRVVAVDLGRHAVERHLELVLEHLGQAGALRGREADLAPGPAQEDQRGGNEGGGDEEMLLDHGEGPQGRKWMRVRRTAQGATREPCERPCSAESIGTRPTGRTRVYTTFRPASRRRRPGRAHSAGASARTVPAQPATLARSERPSSRGATGTRWSTARRWR